MADKYFDSRMQGMVYACRIAQEQGIDALVKEIKRRGVTKVDLYATQSQLNEMWGALSDNIGQNTLTTVAWVLNTEFGFGKDRLSRYKQAFDRAVAITQNLDYMGEHYVTLEDCAVELNKKYNLGLDVSRAALAVEVADGKNPEYKDTKKVNGIINALRLAGFGDAAAWLEQKRGAEND